MRDYVHIEAESRRHRNENADELTSVSIAHDKGFLAGRTVTAEQLEAAAAMLWAVCSVRDCRAWVQLTDAMQEPFRDDARAAFRAAGFYIEETTND